MALPKIDAPTYELTLPSTDVKVKYRPFLVKEEKILLMAMESGKENEIYDATKQIVDSCTFNSLDVETLPMFDLEYIFLNIRAKSVGEISKFKGGILNGGNTLPPVTLPIGALLLNSFRTSRPARLNGAGSLPSKPPNNPPALLTSGESNSACPNSIFPALSIK